VGDGPAVSGQMVEQVSQVLTDRGIRSQKPEVLIDLCRLGVVVARPDVQ